MTLMLSGQYLIDWFCTWFPSWNTGAAGLLQMLWWMLEGQQGQWGGSDKLSLSDISSRCLLWLLGGKGGRRSVLWFRKREEQEGASPADRAGSRHRAGPGCVPGSGAAPGLFVWAAVWSWLRGPVGKALLFRCWLKVLLELELRKEL